MHLEQQACMRLPFMDYRSVHRVEDEIGYTFLLSMLMRDPLDLFQSQIIPIKAVIAGITVVSHIEPTANMRSVNHRT